MLQLAFHKYSQIHDHWAVSVQHQNPCCLVQAHWQLHAQLTHCMEGPQQVGEHCVLSLFQCQHCIHAKQHMRQITRAKASNVVAEFAACELSWRWIWCGCHTTSSYITRLCQSYQAGCQRFDKRAQDQQVHASLGRRAGRATAATFLLTATWCNALLAKL